MTRFSLKNGIRTDTSTGKPTLADYARELRQQEKQRVKLAKEPVATVGHNNPPVDPRIDEIIESTQQVLEINGQLKNKNTGLNMRNRALSKRIATVTSELQESEAVLDAIDAKAREMRDLRKKRDDALAKIQSIYDGEVMPICNRLDELENHVGTMAAPVK